MYLNYSCVENVHQIWRKIGILLVCPLISFSCVMYCTQYSVFLMGKQIRLSQTVYYSTIIIQINCGFYLTLFNTIDSMPLYEAYHAALSAFASLRIFKTSIFEKL
jgi:hypothetical protein